MIGSGGGKGGPLAPERNKPEVRGKHVCVPLENREKKRSEKAGRGEEISEKKGNGSTRRLNSDKRSAGCRAKRSHHEERKRLATAKGQLSGP